MRRLTLSLILLQIACAATDNRRHLKQRLDGAMQDMEAARHPAKALATKNVPAPPEIPLSLPAESETIRFEEIGIGRALSHESLTMARTRAKDDAMAKAMRKSADVFYGFSDYSSKMGKENYAAIARYIFTSSRGVLLEESVGEPQCKITDGIITCRVRVRGKTVFRGRVDPSFHLLNEYQGVPLGLNRRQYYAGEPVEFSLAVTQDAYLYVLSWDHDDNLFLVFPNWLQSRNKVKAGEMMRFPHKDGGVVYRSVLPKGKTSASERLIILATKREILIPESIPKPASKKLATFNIGKMAEIMKKIALLDRSEWMLEVIPYEIRSKQETVP